MNSCTPTEYDLVSDLMNDMATRPKYFIFKDLLHQDKNLNLKVFFGWQMQNKSRLFHKGHQSKSILSRANLFIKCLDWSHDLYLGQTRV